MCVSRESYFSLSFLSHTRKHSRCPALSSNPVCSEMRAIVDAAHVPAPGARDLSIEELNVHGPLFQYWVLLKVGG